MDDIQSILKKVKNVGDDYYDAIMARVRSINSEILKEITKGKLIDREDVDAIYS